MKRLCWHQWWNDCCFFPIQGGAANYYGRSSYSGGGPNSPISPQQQLEVVYLYIPEQSVGAVIGSKGQNIKNIMHLSAARIKVSRTGLAVLVEVHMLQGTSADRCGSSLEFFQLCNHQQPCWITLVTMQKVTQQPAELHLSQCRKLLSSLLNYTCHSAGSYSAACWITLVTVQEVTQQPAELHLPQCRKSGFVEELPFYSTVS